MHIKQTLQTFKVYVTYQFVVFEGQNSMIYYWFIPK